MADLSCFKLFWSFLSCFKTVSSCFKLFQAVFTFFSSFGAPGAKIEHETKDIHQLFIEAILGSPRVDNWGPQVLGWIKIWVDLEDKERSDNSHTSYVLAENFVGVMAKCWMVATLHWFLKWVKKLSTSLQSLYEYFINSYSSNTSMEERGSCQA